ncbi:MAG: glycosyltransferase family 2 protein [Polyangiaceae bacterium]
MTVAILMPAYNEGDRLLCTLHAVESAAAQLGGVTVFLVDDGGEPAIAACDLPVSNAQFHVVLARHAINLGQGAALETARQLALSSGEFQAYLTMDSDGQHDVAGLRAAAEAIERGADVALGSRFLGGSRVPRGRRALLRAAGLFEWALTGRRLGDAHNGLRAFNRRALQAIRIRHNRMAHATEITQHVLDASQWSVVEVPVVISYTPESLRKGQRASAALEILQDLLSHYLFKDST